MFNEQCSGCKNHPLQCTCPEVESDCSAVLTVSGVVVDNTLDSGEWTLSSGPNGDPCGLRTILEKFGVCEGDRIEITVRKL